MYHLGRMDQQALNRIIKDIKNYIQLEKEAGLDEVMLKSIFRHRTRPGPEIKPPLPDKKQALEELDRAAQLCRECSLYKSRRNLVFGEGDPNASLMFIGEAPGMEEDIKGLPFTGKAGALLTRIIEAIGLKREQVYIANCLKCRPPQNRNPFPSEVVACRDFLISQIRIIGPEIICCLGKFSAQNLLISEEPITKLRGKFYDFEGIKVMPTFHPAYLLRNPKDKRVVWEDMKKVRDGLKQL